MFPVRYCFHYRNILGVAPARIRDAPIGAAKSRAKTRPTGQLGTRDGSAFAARGETPGDLNDSPPARPKSAKATLAMATFLLVVRRSSQNPADGDAGKPECSSRADSKSEHLANSRNGKESSSHDACRHADAAANKPSHKGSESLAEAHGFT